METNLKAIELRDLWRRYKDERDEKARERLVLAYAPLVKYVAGRMSSGLPSHVEEADLISYGLLGLISAIERFEPEREIKFETFAITRIKGSIIDELRSLDWVPRSVRTKAREIERANAKLEHELHRAPTDQEMADKLDVSVEEFQESLVRISNSSVVALDELWTVSDASGDQVSLLDTIQDPQALDPAMEMDTTEMKDRLADAIARLPEREKLVVALYYYENLTLREIGEVLGRDRVARLAAPHQGRAAAEVAPAGRSHRRRRVAAVRDRASQQSALAALGQQALAGVELSELLETAAAVAARELEVDQVAVLEHTRDGRGMLARAGVGLPDGVLGGVLPVDPSTLAGDLGSASSLSGRDRRLRDDRGAQPRGRPLHRRRHRLPPGGRQRARRRGRAQRARRARARQRGAVPRARRHHARAHVDDGRRGRRDVRQQGLAALHGGQLGRGRDVRADRPPGRPRGGGAALGGGVRQARGVPLRVPAAPRGIRRLPLGARGGHAALLPGRVRRLRRDRHRHPRAPHDGGGAARVRGELPRPGRHGSRR